MCSHCLLMAVKLLTLKYSVTANPNVNGSPTIAITQHHPVVKTGYYSIINDLAPLPTYILCNIMPVYIDLYACHRMSTHIPKP